MNTINPATFSIEQWEDIILNNHSKEVSKFVNSMNSKNLNQLEYDTENKTINYGIYKLTLSVLLKPSNEKESNTLTPLNKQNVKNLAKCLKISCAADRIEKTKRKISSSEDANKRARKITKISDENIENKENIKEQKNTLILATNCPPLIERSLNNSSTPSEKITKIVPPKNLNIIQGVSTTNLAKNLTPTEMVKKLVLAIKLGNIKEVTKLLAQGADVNFLDINDQSLLHLAVKHNQPAIVGLLIEKGANINYLDKHGHPLLFLALKNNYSNIIENPLLLSTLNENNMEVIRLLLANGANPNFADKNGVTLLMKATDCGNFEVCKMLMSHGADLNLKDSEGQTLLMRILSKLKLSTPETISILKSILESNHININIKNNLDQLPIFFIDEIINHPEIFIKLVENGLDINFKDNGKSLITYLKHVRPKNYQKMINSILKLQPNMKNEYKILNSRSQVAHSWHVDGHTLLIDSKGSLNASLLGGFSQIWFHQMSKSLSQFMSNYPGAINHPERFKDALIRSANDSLSTSEQKLKCVKNFEPLFLNTGFKKHTVTLLIWGERFIICNLGDGMRKRIESFHFNPNLLTAEHLNEIEQISNCSKEEYQTLFFEKLKNELKLEKEPVDNYLDILGEENLKNQTVGNCSWTSPMASIFSFLVLDAFTEGVSEEKLEETIKKNVKTYHQWDRFQKINSLEKMLKLTGKLGYNSDFNLIYVIGEKAKEDPLLDEQLSVLMKTYEMNIITQMMTEKLSVDDS